MKRASTLRGATSKTAPRKMPNKVDALQSGIHFPLMTHGPVCLIPNAVQVILMSRGNTQQ